MIVILNGPLGVGKTEVAWKIIEKFERAVMLDGDYLGAVHPFEIRDEQRVAYLYDAALKYDLADRYRTDRVQYTESKTDFVRRVLAMGRVTM